MKKILLFLSIITSLSYSLKAQNHSPETIIKASLDAYNRLNIDEFMAYFSDDIEMVNFHDHKVTAKGTEEVRAIFELFFNASPNLHSKIVSRIVFDNKVIDHESVTGARGNKEPFEIVVIYEVVNEQIVRMTMVRKGK